MRLQERTPNQARPRKSFQPLLRFYLIVDADGYIVGPIVVSTLLEILEHAHRCAGAVFGIPGSGFQPFLRFWASRPAFTGQLHLDQAVSTLLEILARCLGGGIPTVHVALVSTLLEILGVLRNVPPPRPKHRGVSTLLEILRLVDLVVVGF